MSKIGDLFANKIYRDIGVNSFDTLFGIAYAGILLCYLAAESLRRKFSIEKRFAYNRKEMKKHGDPKNMLIAGGHFSENDTILLVDDVLTTGNTKLELKTQLEENFPNLRFRGLLVFLDRCEIDEKGRDAEHMLKKKGLPVFSVLSATEILSDPLKVPNKKTFEELRNYFGSYSRR